MTGKKESVPLFKKKNGNVEKRLANIDGKNVFKLVGYKIKIFDFYLIKLYFCLL